MSYFYTAMYHQTNAVIDLKSLVLTRGISILLIGFFILKENFIEPGKALTKGQLISKCPYEKSVLSKLPTKIFPRFLP